MRVERTAHLRFQIIDLPLELPELAALVDHAFEHGYGESTEDSNSQPDGYFDGTR